MDLLRQGVDRGLRLLEPRPRLEVGRMQRHYGHFRRWNRWCMRSAGSDSQRRPSTSVIGVVNETRLLTVLVLTSLWVCRHARGTGRQPCSSLVVTFSRNRCFVREIRAFWSVTCEFLGPQGNARPRHLCTCLVGGKSGRHGSDRDWSTGSMFGSV